MPWRYMSKALRDFKARYMWRSGVGADKGAYDVNQAPVTLGSANAPASHSKYSGVCRSRVA